ncbi:MAG: hypothetical protein WDN26_05825 [Chitinophagaceae bacterium]
MQTAILHNPTTLVNRIPVYFTINQKKARRYILCLEMVETVLQDFFPQKKIDNTTRPLFQTLGQVACCIDNHLDDLALDQKEYLQEIFPVFFYSLSNAQDEAAFSDRIWELCHQVGTSLYPPSLCTDLFQFYSFCTKHNLVQELKTFSIGVIQSAITKAKAKDAKEILESLALEGNAAVTFLLQLLQKENRIHASDKKFYKLKKYLSQLEKMLNIADDLSDYKKDKSKGTITLHAKSGYYFSLSSRLLKIFFSTSITFHFIFLKHFFLFTRRYILSEIK